MPSLARLAQSYDPRSFEVVAISVDEGWEPIETFLAGQKVPFRVVWDEGSKTARAWGASRYPASYLLDAEGRLQLRFLGPRNWMDPNVATLLQGYGARLKG
jgi:hypothetical protein